MKRLDNKVAIVTGASKGLGAGIAKAFGAEGAAVIVNYARDQAGAERNWCARSPAKAGEPSPCKATWRRGPTRNASSLGGEKSLRPSGCAREQRRRVLICALRAVQRAGVSPAVQHERAWHVPPDRSRFAGGFGAEGGSIINIGSTASVTANPTLSDLRGDKERCQWLDARALKKRFGPRKIRVNALNPGATETAEEFAHGGGRHGNGV